MVLREYKLALRSSSVLAFPLLELYDYFVRSEPVPLEQVVLVFILQHLKLL